jgi:pimeloyl-ACP methyl ester carboxylesterase
MTSTSETAAPPQAPTKDYVYSLHGIRTNAFWQSLIDKEIRTYTKFATGHRNYLRFDIIMFVLKDIFYHKPLRLVESDLRKLQQQYRVSVIAHSFGTWLILKALVDNRDIKVHNLILCGGIFPRATSLWRQLKNDTFQITGKIVNFCGLRDPFPALAELLSRDFGASGTVGAGDPVVEDSFHDLGHSGFLTHDFCKTHWIPILLSQNCHPLPATKPRLSIAALLWLAAHRGAALVTVGLLGFSGYWLYGLEYTCMLRSCFVDMVRIYDYSSSTREPGSSRSYVSQITFEYTFNYDLDEYLFRAPADRRAVVISFLGEQLTPIQPTESSEPVATADGKIERKWQAFRLPVVKRHAYFSAEFANNSLEAPDGLAAFATRPIRNFRGEIIVPQDVTLIPTKEEFRKGILVGSVPQSDEYTNRCKFSSDGKAIRCTGLYMPSNREFYYCFAVKGWNAPDRVSKNSVEGCQQTAPVN